MFREIKRLRQLAAQAGHDVAEPGPAKRAARRSTAAGGTATATSLPAALMESGDEMRPLAAPTRRSGTRAVRSELTGRGEPSASSDGQLDGAQPHVGTLTMGTCRQPTRRQARQRQPPQHGGGEGEEPTAGRSRRSAGGGANHHRSVV
ncbi:hypothetical protein AB1Y20_012919 [Prymnesium parvum]|uniref:Uncharacterized protein n=1 Tax=Prymnesium parvum TaxID=97485 RepID=A0AB34IM42_PRYPA